MAARREDYCSLGGGKEGDLSNPTSRLLRVGGIIGVEAVWRRLAPRKGGVRARRTGVVPDYHFGGRADAIHPKLWNLDARLSRDRMLAPRSHGRGLDALENHPPERATAAS